MVEDFHLMFGQEADRWLHQVFRKLTLDVGRWTMVFSASFAAKQYSTTERRKRIVNYETLSKGSLSVLCVFARG